MRESAQGSQQLLFPGEAAWVRTERRSPRSTLPRAAAEPPQADQHHLFAGVVLLRTAIDGAVAQADFAEAARLRATLTAEHGEHPTDLAYLDELASCAWDAGAPEPLLAAWRAACARIESPSRSHAVSDAFFTRLASVTSPATVAALDPSCLPHLVGALERAGHDEVARGLVRDALLAGQALAPLDFDEPSTRDVLAEDLAPERLACLGTVRHAWSVPTPAADELAAYERSLAAPLPESEADRALDFWRCLRVTTLRPRLPEPLLHGARARMRLLDAELHAAHLQRLL